MADRAGTLRRIAGLGLELAEHGRGADQSAPGRGKKPGPNPTDRGKSGVKRSLLTEAQGIPVGLAVDGANRHDMKLVRGHGGQPAGAATRAQSGDRPGYVPG